MKPKKLLPKKLLLLSIIALVGCTITLYPGFRQVYNDYNSFIHTDSVKANFLKVHYKNGYVSVFDNWEINSYEDTLTGKGKLFDINRNELSEGNISVAMDDIAIIETNQLEKIRDRYSDRITRLTILSAVDAVFGVICITNPKACFGSCPTFYINETQNVHYSNAEGFSSSISPSLEKKDIDALDFRMVGGPFNIIMKNEALETHVINEVQLIAAEVDNDSKIYHSSHDQFFQSNDITSCLRAFNNKKEITEDIKNIDELEYFSFTDSLDLNKKEEIIFEFNRKSKKSVGLILNFRQSLLTTFLLYNGLSYMGDEVGDYFAKIETNNQIRKKLGNPFKKLGGIKIYYFNEEKDKWVFADEIHETGPIAKNLQIIPLGDPGNINEKYKVKIEMTQGMWRLDYAALAAIDKEISPYFISPSEIWKDNLSDEIALSEVNCDDNNYLITFPGDNYDIHFDLPPLSKNNTTFELFLFSKGYYIEWMREDWLKNKNTVKLEKMLLYDEAEWKNLAIEYKIAESQMEELFWNSKYINIQ